MRSASIFRFARIAFLVKLCFRISNYECSSKTEETCQVLVCADGANLLGKKLNTINENTELHVVASKYSRNKFISEK